jgi:hypothetical protein
VNELLLQTFDGLPIKSPSEPVRCTECNLRVKEGKEVIAHFYLDEHWRLEGIYCPHCYANNTYERSPDGTEEAVVEARLITRLDRAEQTTTPAIHTRGSYKILRHTRENDEATTGGGNPTTQEDRP